MASLLKLLVFLLLMLSSNELFAQEDSKYYLIYTKKGSKFRGTIKEHDKDKIIFIADDVGEIIIKNENVKSIRQTKRKRPWNNLSFDTKYFLSPNAIAPIRGQSYYQNSMGLFNQIDYAVANNFSIGLGTVPLFFSFGEPWPIWARAKYTLPSKNENVHVAVGGLIGHVLVADNDPTIALGYGLLTLGNRKNNFTLGISYGKYEGNVQPYPITNLSANIHVWGPVYVLTENYLLINSEGEFYSYSMVGGKLNWKSLEFDWGVVVPRNTGDPWISFPIFGVTLPIGRG